MNEDKSGGILRNIICSPFLHKNLSSWMVLSEPSRYCSCHNQNMEIQMSTRFKVYQMKVLMIHYIVALVGKKVSISYGLKEPWKLWLQAIPQ